LLAYEDNIKELIVKTYYIANIKMQFSSILFKFVKFENEKYHSRNLKLNRNTLKNVE